MPLILAESASGLVIMTCAQARAHLQNQLEDHDLVGDLLHERRRASAVEDDA